jgi:glycolate oxidase iron-sulfur subunit
MDTVFSVLCGIQKFLYPLLYMTGKVRYLPPIASQSFKSSTRVFKNTKKIGRVSVFAGCSVNYFYPHLGDSLLHILLTMGYEVVIIKGEVCCGAPMRAFGLEKETKALAKKNIALFNKMKTEAILSMCPTCTMTIKNQYPLLTGDTIEKIMDINEFFYKNDIVKALKGFHSAVTYHDPCHLRHGLGITDEPREILKGIEGIKLIEMKNPEDCCGFGGFFSMNFKELSCSIGGKKLDSIKKTWADTVITSCPGCMTQLEDIRAKTGTKLNIMHIVEVIDEALHG